MSTSPRILTIMGSGETAPTMMKHHRELIARFPGTPKAVVLDTPYGFQENSAELASKAVEYFRKSVGHPIEIAGLTRLHGQDTLTVEQGLSRVRQADYVFAGPGSPTYALRQWAGTSVPDIVRGKMRTGGAVTFASAAALTLGRYTVPVYEIYKVGQDVQRLDGLDVLSSIGINAAVIPHYDNAEGGHHDTRFCYLGEARLRGVAQRLGDVGVAVAQDVERLALELKRGHARGRDHRGRRGLVGQERDLAGRLRHPVARVAEVLKKFRSQWPTSLKLATLEALSSP